MASTPRTHLTSLQTPLGLRSVYDSVCFCNRCGLCMSVCPAYRHTLQEPFSPRGLNQTLRLVLKNKALAGQSRDMLEQMLGACNLCGECVLCCPGQIPTVEHVLELRRRSEIYMLPGTLFQILRLRQTAPWLFARLVRVGLKSRRMGILRMLSSLSKFAWLKHVLEIIPPEIAEYAKILPPAAPTLIYLPSLEADTLLPELFTQTYHLACKQHKPLVWRNTASGLFEYVYGDVRRARRLVRQLIVRHAQIAGGTLPLLTDSIDVYNFLRQAGQLFSAFPAFKYQAEHFAQQVCFVTDLFPSKLSKGAFSTPVELMPAALFSSHTSPCLKAGEILGTLFGKNFVQCEYKDGSVSPCGYGFVKHTHAPAYISAAVQTVAAHQTKTVFVLSGLAALELAFYLQKFYPTAQARHIVELHG